ncbi:MAG: YciI family protein [Bacteroidota bacterium]
MNKYLILLFDHEDMYANSSPQDMQEEVALHGQWIEELGDHYVGGEALQESSRSIRGAQHVVSDGPFIESKEIIGGFYMLQAKDLEEATELAKGCPTLRLGGGLEIRPVMDFENMDW